MAQLEIPSFQEIYDVLKAAVLAEDPTLNDWADGSNLDVLAAGAAGAADECYLKIIEALSIFYIATAEGDDLDARVGDFGMTRNSGETDVELRARVPEYLASLARATKTAVEAGAKTVSGCTQAKAYDYDDDPTIDLGWIDLYIAATAGAASGALVTAVDAEMPSWKAAGCHVNVSAASVIGITYAITMTIDGGYSQSTVRAAVEAALLAWTNTLEIGEDLNIADAATVAGRIDGVSTLDDFQVNASYQNQAIDVDEVAKYTTVSW